MEFDLKWNGRLSEVINIISASVSEGDVDTFSMMQCPHHLHAHLKVYFDSSFLYMDSARKMMQEKEDFHKPS